MKNLSLLSLILIATALLFGCSNNKTTTENADLLIGKWKNTTSPNTGIEFTKTGEYNVWINGESMNDSLGEGMKPLKYIYEPKAKDYNLKISEDFEKDQTIHHGKIEILDSNKIKITMTTNDVHLTAEFNRLKNF